VNFGVRAFQNGVEVTTPSIDTSVTGKYEIVYKVFDGSGSILAEAVRVVNVVGPKAIVESAATSTPLVSDTGTSSETASSIPTVQGVATGASTMIASSTTTEAATE
jgi:hypothetical protein